MRITPTSVDGETCEDPIWYAANHATPGSVVEMEPGTYSAPHYFEDVKPAQFKGLGDGVVIGAGGGSTLYFTNPKTCRNVKWSNMTIMGGEPAAVITDGKTEKEFPVKEDRYYQRLEFDNVVVAGPWTPGDSGANSKWGMRLHQVTGATFIGCRFYGFFEHGAYMTQLGWLDTFFMDCKFDGNGRTGSQTAHRQFENDGEMGSGELRFRRCTFTNNGIADGGGAITVSGVRGVTWIEDCTVLCTEKGNAIVHYSEYDPDNPDYPKPGSPNYALAVSGLQVTAEKCVRSPIQIGGTEIVHFHKGLIGASKNPATIWINGRKYGMGGQKFRTKEVRTSLTGFVYGGLWVNDETRSVWLP